MNIPMMIALTIVCFTDQTLNLEREEVVSTKQKHVNRTYLVGACCFMKHTEALGQQTHPKPCLIAQRSYIVIPFFGHLQFAQARVSFKTKICCQHKLSEEGLVFIAIGGTVVSVFGTLNSEAELHFTFNVLLKQ